MNIRKEIADLIHAEQIRQNGEFCPDVDGYLQKLAERAEVVSHDEFGRCKGFVFFYCNDPQKQSSYITLLMVAPDSRNAGVGAALLRYVLFLTRQRGFKFCRLEVRKSNNAAIRLYESMNFRTVGDRGEKYLMETDTSQ